MNLNGCLNNLFIIVFEVWKLVNQVITDINFTDRYFGHIFLSNVKDFRNTDLT